MKTIIVTAADEKYAEMALGLLRSLHQWGELPCGEIGLLDLGLSEASRNALSPYVSVIAEPGWDFAIAPESREQRPHLRALLARPKLPNYFPGRDLYLWLDADMWVQDRAAIDLFFTAAASGAMGLVPSNDRCYVYHPTHIQWRWDNLSSYFGQEASNLYHYSPYYNAGAFSLRGDAIHWSLWEKWFTQALANDPGRVCDQAVLNFAIWKEALAIYPLPSRCNWLCQYSIPAFDLSKRLFLEPYIPHMPLGILHLAGRSKNHTVKTHFQDGILDFDLRYGSLPAALDKWKGSKGLT